MRARVRLGVALLGVGVAACAPSVSGVKVKDKPPPSAFSKSASGPSIAQLGWRSFFPDPRLQALIEGSLRQSPDLGIALQRIELMRAGARQSAGVMLPQLSLGVGAGVQKVGRYTPEGAGNAGTEIVPGRPVPTHIGELSVGLQASWEVDAWGRLRNLRHAAIARYLASVEGMNVVRSALVADMASAYFELLALDQTRDVLEQTLTRQQEALDVVRLQMQAGRANELAVQQFAAQLAGTKTLMVQTEKSIREAERAVNLLRGSYAGEIPRRRASLLDDVAPLLSTGLPSELLRNRPDVRAAEAEIEAAKADLRAARAAFFPSINLAAGLGFEAFEPRYLLRTPESLVYSASAGLVAPLVNRAAIRAQFDAAKAVQLQAMYQYQKVVLEAYAEVVNSLSRLEAGARITTLRQERQAAVAQTIDAADALYRAGKASYFEVLLAQQNSLSAELELIEARRDQHLAAVSLYRALGGGWR